MKTTRITIETERTLIVRRAEHVVGWCSLCDQRREFILVDDNASAEPSLSAQIQQWRNAGKLHLSQQENGLTRICLASLLCCFESDRN